MPQRLEQFDQALTAHLQPETSWQLPLQGGTAPSCSKQSELFRLGHSTLLVRVPRPHLSEQGDHLLAFHLHLARLLHASAASGSSPDSLQNLMLPFVQITSLRLSPAPQVVLHSPQSLTSHRQPLTLVQASVSGGTAQRSLKQSEIWLLVHNTVRRFTPVPHELLQWPQSPARHWQPLNSLHSLSVSGGSPRAALQSAASP